VPLSEFQSKLVRLLAQNRSEESHLAGGAALHFAPNSIRYSEDLDYFHDSDQAVATSFAKDKALLEENKYILSVEINQVGYIRSIIKKDSNSTKIEWAKDSIWRFMPVQSHADIGFVLHPIDLCTNKLLALVGRDEARDFLDVIENHKLILPLGAQCWAACGKDPGLSPDLILDLLKRRGKYQKEDFARLHLLNNTINLIDLKSEWLSMLSEAEKFIAQAPKENLGCLFYAKEKKIFVQPSFDTNEFVIPHYGKKGGVVPIFK